MNFDWGRFLQDIANLELIGSLMHVLVLAIIALIIFEVIKRKYHKHAIKPEEEKINSDFQTLTHTFLNKIYDSFDKKGIKLPRSYPSHDQVVITDRPIYLFSVYYIKPNSRNKILTGDVGEILVNRGAIWKHEDRIKTAAMSAAWWFNLYFCSRQGNEDVIKIFHYKGNILKTGKMRRIFTDTLKIAGLSKFLELQSKETVDLVHVFHKKERIEEKHRTLMHIETEEIEQIERELLREERLNGTPQKIHKLSLARQHHIEHLIKKGTELIKLLETDEELILKVGKQSAHRESELLQTNINQLRELFKSLNQHNDQHTNNTDSNNILKEKLDSTKELLTTIAHQIHRINILIEFK
ncbi:hypothetical protein HN587_01195 [Candidatus Woesearchaeota archaeon]|jgi:hypothetical protein|nr:hypothetical protein [Candidatus Woesearchaeota archaeon]